MLLAVSIVCAMVYLIVCALGNGVDGQNLSKKQPQDVIQTRQKTNSSPPVSSSSSIILRLLRVSFVFAGFRCESSTAMRSDQVWQKCSSTSPAAWQSTWLHIHKYIHTESHTIERRTQFNYHIYKSRPRVLRIPASPPAPRSANDTVRRFLSEAVPRIAAKPGACGGRRSDPCNMDKSL